MTEPKTDCVECGREILVGTADRNNGMCKPCFRAAENYAAYLKSQTVYQDAGPSIAGFRKAFSIFTDQIASIFRDHPICEDTAVRDEISVALQHTLLRGDFDSPPQSSYSTSDADVDSQIQESLETFFQQQVVREFVQQHAGELRVKLIRTMMTDRSVVSKSGDDLFELLGEWV